MLAGRSGGGNSSPADDVLVRRAPPKPRNDDYGDRQEAAGSTKGSMMAPRDDSDDDDYGGMKPKPPPNRRSEKSESRRARRGLAPSADADAASSPERAKEPRPNSMRQADNHSRDEDNNGRAARRAARRNQNPDADDDLLPPMEAPRGGGNGGKGQDDDDDEDEDEDEESEQKIILRGECPFCKMPCQTPLPPTGNCAHLRCGAQTCGRSFAIEIPGRANRPGSARKIVGALLRPLSARRQSSSTSTNTSSDSSSCSGNEQGEGGGDCNGDDNSLHANCPHCKALTIAPVPDRGKIAYLRCFQCRKMYGVRVPRDMADQRPRSARGSSARRGSKNSAWDRDDVPGIRKLGAVRRSTDEEYDRAVEIQ